MWSGGDSGVSGGGEVREWLWRGQGGSAGGVRGGGGEVRGVVLERSEAPTPPHHLPDHPLISPSLPRPDSSTTTPFLPSPTTP